MKKFRLFKLRRLLFLLLFTFLFVNSHALYLGWNQNKLNRYLHRHAGLSIELVKQGSSEVTYFFERGTGITRMIFYFNMEGRCTSYSVIYNLRYADELSQFLNDNFTYNRAEDYYENNRCKLYYEGGKIQHRIYITDKRVNKEVSISMK